MPRPNPLRSLQSEANLAKRIAYERDRLGWTYDGTAKRMTDVGCAIQGSAIYKIEKGNPPRRISVDELVAFGKVFRVDVADLLVPMDALMSEAATRLFERWTTAREEMARWAAERDASEAALKDHMAAHPDTVPALESAIRAWAEVQGWDSDEATDYWLLTMRGVPKGSPEWADFFDRTTGSLSKERGGKHGKRRAKG